MNNGAGITEESLSELGFWPVKRSGGPVFVNGIELREYQTGGIERTYVANDHEYKEKVWLFLQCNAGYWCCWFSRLVHGEWMPTSVQAVHLVDIQHLRDFVEVCLRGTGFTTWPVGKDEVPE